MLPPIAPPMPTGYHTHQQRVSHHGVNPSPSRPMSPGEQFDQIKIKENWAKELAGIPSGEDLRVSMHIVIVCTHCYRVTDYSVMSIT